MSNLLNSNPNHPWIGALLWDTTSFLGIIDEVSEDRVDPGDGYLYVRYVYNDGERDGRYVHNSCVASDGILRV